MPGIQHFDVLILGAGAAGLMCAIEAGKRGRRVALLERADRVGKKILISGGGRCNFTNIHCKPENFISANPHFCKSALARYTPTDFVALVEKHKVPYHEKTLGQLFCDGSSREIVQMLLVECRRANVEIAVDCRVENVERADSRFVVRTSKGDFRAPSLVVATGGLSIPKMGATSLGYDLAKQFGISIVKPYPALVPLIFTTMDLRDYSGLAGVSTEVVVSIGGQMFREKMLFTHRGLSGPAILQISSYWKDGDVLHINLAPDHEVTAELLSSTARRDLNALRSALRKHLPARLADRWLDLHGPPDFTNHGLREFERRLHDWQLTLAGTEGYAKAEVTAGGINTEELSAKTMECKKVPSFFFIGEVVDVTGHLGGFNFQWAWSSGFVAGRAV